MSALANPKNRLNDTLAFFLDQVSYTGPLDYESWANLKTQDEKLAVLYIQFFDQICFAWAKARAEYIDDDDLVSVVIQYLTKNVKKIEDDPKRFTPQYIQTVAYNCMDCLRCNKGPRNKFYNEIPTVLKASNDGADEELDVFNIIGCEDDVELEHDREAFWDIIESMGKETEKVVQNLITDKSLRRVWKNSSAYEVDPLADVSVSEERKEEIIEELRQKLAPFLSVDFYQAATM